MAKQKRTEAGEKKDWLTFDKWDQGGFALTLLGAAVIAVVMSIVNPIRRWIAGEPLVVTVGADVKAPELDRNGVAYDKGTEVLAKIADPEPWQRMLHLGVHGGIAIAFVLIVWLTLRFMAQVMKGEPFGAGQVRRLRTIAGLLLLGIGGLSLLGSMVGSLVLYDGDGFKAPVTVTMPLPWMPLLLGLAVAMVAEAFKAGGRLRDDVDGLI